LNNSESRKFVCKLGFLLSHSVLYLAATLLSRVLYVKSEETDETSNNVQRGLPFRINSMIDLDTYYVPIFIHCSICEFMYAFLLTVIDVLYLTMVEYCCVCLQLWGEPNEWLWFKHTNSIIFEFNINNETVYLLWGYVFKKMIVSKSFWV